MGHGMTRLVVQLAVIIITARLSGYIFSRYLKQPKVLGELIAGMIIGPYALGGISLPMIGQPLFPQVSGFLPVSSELYAIAVIASIVLLFRAGLETDLSIFLRYSVVGSVVGLGGVIVSFFLGSFMAVAWGFADSLMSPTALLLGTVSTATSVGLTAQILSEKRKMSSPEGVTILSGAVLDDVLGIIILAIVVGIKKTTGSDDGIMWGKIGIVAIKALGFWLVCTILGILLAPRITHVLKWFHSNDVIAGVAFGLALFLSGLSEMAGLAMIIGAYVTGLSLSQTDVVHEIHERLNGIYQFLVPVFFCVMGMMVNFAGLKPVLGFGLVYSAMVVLGKMIGCGLPAWLMGFNLRGAFRIGAGMLPRGEVTLIVAGIGLSSGIITPELFGVAVMALFITDIIAPALLIKSFEGGSGVRTEIAGRKNEETRSVELDFSSVRVTAFMRMRIEDAFRNEEFFVHRMDADQPICQIRKEDIVITLMEEGSKLILTTSESNEQLVRFIVLEEILELKDLIKTAQEMKSPDSMGKELVNGMFGA
ncbi:cation:proton antiporter [Verrucomicrobiota bacterium]